MNAILAIDIGTTSTKALLVQADGSILFSTQVFYETRYPTWGHAEQDPMELLDAVKKAIAEIASVSKISVEGASFSCAMHSLIAVDAHGKPLTQAMIWSDIRAYSEASELKHITPELLQSTGTPIHPMSPLCKLIWLRKNKKEIFDRAHKFVSIKEFIFFHLFGTWQVDFSIASATGLFNVHELKWSAAALKMAGIDESRLSTCVSPYSVYSSLSQDVARQLGLNKSTPFVIGSGDGCLANFGSNVMYSGELSLTIGTSGAMRMTSDHFQNDSRQRLFNYRLDEKYFVSGGATNNGSVVLDWYQKNFLQGSSSVEKLIKDGMATTPGAEGLLFLPYVYGERSPFYNSNARGVFFGLAQQHGQAHLIRAMIEGICFEMKSLFSALRETGAEISVIRASGGFTQSIEWVQCLADVLGKPVNISSTKDASAMGAARMGFDALGIANRFEQDRALSQCEPRTKFSEMYDSYYRLFADLTSSLQQNFDKIASWQR